MKAHELWQTIQRMEKKVQRNKIKRLIYTVLAYTAAFMGLCYWQGQIGDFPKFLALLIVCLVLAGIFVWAGIIIFYQLFECGRSEDNMLKSLRKQYHEACEKEKGSGKNDSVPNE
jgi:hypothetical protein